MFFWASNLPYIQAGIVLEYIPLQNRIEGVLYSNGVKIAINGGRWDKEVLVVN